jgi:hypothetical protein
MNELAYHLPCSFLIVFVLKWLHESCHPVSARLNISWMHCAAFREEGRIVFVRFANTFGWFAALLQNF